MTPELKTLYEESLAHHAEVSGHPHVVRNSIPIPFFGDVDAYMGSHPRIVTAALNPSGLEFPDAGEPRFDVTAALTGPAGLEKELSAYFRRNPYTQWFGNFEQVLNGMGATYGGVMPARAHPLTALHLDLCSPIATAPTWSRLIGANREDLRGRGRQLFELAIRALEPDIIVASVGPAHLQDWRPEFAAGAHWKTVVSYTHKENRQPYRSPLVVRATEATFGAKRSIPFANGSAAILPFGNFTHPRKREAGAALRRYLGR